ncbi:MAG: hypothetical protein WAX77_08775 [Methylococcaceae bacterium]
MKNPEEILKKWMTAVNEGSIKDLLALYDEQAVLIPTFSNRILNNPQKIQEYFEKLTSREELSIALHQNTLITQPLADETYALCGIYCWRFAIDGELFSFEARFSYLLNLNLERPIIQHHSSQIPRML